VEAQAMVDSEKTDVKAVELEPEDEVSVVQYVRSCMGLCMG
jgi:hypothetical protein